jgi:hypothetical protein
MNSQSTFGTGRLGDLVQYVDGQAVGALRHRRDPEVRAARNQRRQERSVGPLRPWPVAGQGGELAREAAP